MLCIVEAQLNAYYHIVPKGYWAATTGTNEQILNNCSVTIESFSKLFFLIFLYQDHTISLVDIHCHTLKNYTFLMRHSKSPISGPISHHHDMCLIIQPVFFYFLYQFCPNPHLYLATTNLLHEYTFFMKLKSKKVVKR